MFASVIGNPFANKNTKLLIDRKVVQRLFAEGQEALPKEYSAMLAGHGPHVTKHFAAPLSDTDSRTFAWSGPSLIGALRDMRAEGLEWIGVFHTHPTTPAVPSSADRLGWHYPTLGYWIASLEKAEPTLCLYQMADGVFIPRPFVIM